MTQVIPFVPKQIALQMLQTPPINRGEWQSDGSSLRTYEFRNAIFEISPGSDIQMFANYVHPDLPWAEKHFQERISGEPLNPPPSADEWPWHQAAKEKHTQDKQYSHTYPERFWPKYAGNTSKAEFHGGWEVVPHSGIRFDYGDLNDILELLMVRPFTRQAYLPIFFPEDTGAQISQRIPCTLGYHFIRNGSKLDCNYFIRSCDMTRHLRNDVYMAGRLLQHVVEKTRNEFGIPHVGRLTMFISNLHIFEEDAWRWAK